MPLLETPAAQTGMQAPGFTLKGVDGLSYDLAGVRGPNGLLVMFICNHCPYVKAVIDRVVGDAKELQSAGIGVVAIMPNDTLNYPQDSFENMKKFAAAHGMTFPYLIDETQQTAKAYDAVCTPDFFGFDAGLKLAYRGRLDESWQLTIPNPKRELLLAMKEIASGRIPREKQHPSMGCSIKWK